jgi:hypothetical protein
MVTPKTLHNKMSNSRNSEDVANRPPEPEINGGGQTPDSYSYAAIRPWLLAAFAPKAMRFPESFDEAKSILAETET